MSISKLLLNGIFRAGIDKEEERIVFSRVDLDHFVNALDRTSILEEKDLENEVKLFRNALDFSKVKLREIMVPRTEMVALDITSSMEELRQKFIETGYSRILFYEGNIDNIIGYLHHSMIFANPESIRPNLKKVLIVPETMPASKLLSKFIQQHRSIAIVVDEFGGTSGIVITSYSIHYTKLYDVVGALLGLGREPREIAAAYAEPPDPVPAARRPGMTGETGPAVAYLFARMREAMLV